MGGILGTPIETNLMDTDNIMIVFSYVFGNTVLFSFKKLSNNIL